MFSMVAPQRRVLYPAWRLTRRAFHRAPTVFAVGKDVFSWRPPSDLTLRQDAEVVRKTAYFDEVKKDLRDKNAFRHAIGSFLARDNVRRAGHVEFIYAALKRVQAFGVHKDLETYKDIMNIFPKGRFVAHNMWQVEFMHYPRHQECGLDVLCEMEKHGVVPDFEMYHIVLNIFGERSIVMRKLKRMNYWFPKFRNANPYPIPFFLPNDPTEKARLALERMCPDVRKEVTVFQTEDISEALDKTWIASLMCPDQRKLISEHVSDKPLYVDGEYSVHLREEFLKYFILRDEPQELLDAGPTPAPEPYYELDCRPDWDLFFKVENPKEYAPLPTLHEQEDGNILAICITGTSSQDSLRSWLSCLARTNPRIAQVPIHFRIRSIQMDTEIITEEQAARENEASGFISTKKYDDVLIH
ncbi:Evolutionarily conserved signaling intermediate in Toll pathway, mitochondrial [Hypsibius exemplaris]|uniref:Evolutionarily conserved signaling intermediate in Toll pathway, mitochondrial n=1 Tax=Hypsibius exemplaris TaxID=2072580 RepID=A0A1W0WYN9_HYPEX|nr:Evolutionarily conserved signaling intermediate in Toll pathway, mitochondrial [Hypsibius exemplaris]